jgi:hypothetical protein
VRKFVTVSIVSLLLLVLSYTTPIWVRNPGGFWILMIGLIIFISFLWLVIKLVKEVIAIVKNKNKFVLSDLLSSSVIVAALGFLLFVNLPINIEEELLVKLFFGRAMRAHKTTRHFT